MRVLTQFSTPAARALAEGLTGRTLRALLQTQAYESKHVILFVDDERLRFEPDGLGPVGYSDPGPFNPRNLRPMPGFPAHDALFDGAGRRVTRIEGVIAATQLTLDLNMERDYGPDGELRERALVAHIAFEITLADGRVYELVSDGEETRYAQAGGFDVSPGGPAGAR
jgi:hypothetical protein